MKLQGNRSTRVLRLLGYVAYPIHSWCTDSCALDYHYWASEYGTRNSAPCSGCHTLHCVDAAWYCTRPFNHAPVVTGFAITLHLSLPLYLHGRGVNGDNMGQVIQQQIPCCGCDDIITVYVDVFFRPTVKNANPSTPRVYPNQRFR